MAFLIDRIEESDAKTYVVCAKRGGDGQRIVFYVNKAGEKQQRPCLFDSAESA